MPTFDQLPLEINYCQSIEVINNLNEYWSGQYLFRMPNIDEWEFVCNRDIFNDNFSVFPWGDSEESYCANYINSFCPLDTGMDENGLCSVGFHEYTFPAYCSNIQGIYDLSGNVNEWIFSGVDNSCNGTATSKGGSYYDQPSSIECSYDGFLNVPMDKIDGMGLRLVMEIINNE